MSAARIAARSTTTSGKVARGEGRMRRVRSLDPPSAEQNTEYQDHRRGTVRDQQRARTERRASHKSRMVSRGRGGVPRHVETAGASRPPIHGASADAQQSKDGDWPGWRPQDDQPGGYHRCCRDCQQDSRGFARVKGHGRSVDVDGSESCGRRRKAAREVPARRSRSGAEASVNRVNFGSNGSSRICRINHNCLFVALSVQSVRSVRSVFESRCTHVSRPRQERREERPSPTAARARHIQ